MSEPIFTLKNDAAAARIYAQLKKDGVKDEELDRGYEDVAPDGKALSTTGSKNGNIEPQEVYDYVLGQLEKYGDLFAKEMGIRIPWILPSEQNQSPKMKAYRDWITSTATAVMREMKKTGIAASDPRYISLLEAGFMLAVGEPDQSLPSDKNELAPYLPAFEKIASKPPLGNVSCLPYLPMDSAVDQGCAGNRSTIFLSISHVAAATGQTSGWRVLGFDNHTASVFLNYLAGKQKITAPILWESTSNRMVLALMMLFGGTADESNEAAIAAGSMLRSAKYLAPEWGSPHIEYGRWLAREPKGYAEAEKEFRLALAIDPVNLRAMKELGRIMFEQKRWNDIIALFTPLAESKEPVAAKALAWGWIGSAHAGAGRFAEALKANLASTNLDPGISWVQRNTASSYLQLHQPAPALDRARKAIALDPKDAEAYIPLISALRDNNKSAEAIEVGEKACAAFPHHLELHLILIEQLLRAGNNARAATIADKAMTIAPSSAKAMLVAGMARAGMRDFMAARQIMAKIDPKKLEEKLRAWYHSIQGVCLMESSPQNLVEAESHLRKAMKLSPGEENSHFNLAVLLQRTGRSKQALDVILPFQKHLGSIRLDLLIGQLYDDIHQPDKAGAIFDECLRREPDNLDVMRNACVSLFQRNRFDEALALADAVIAKKPAKDVLVSALYIRGRSLLKKNREQEAAAAFDQAIALDLPWADPYNERGLIAHRNKDLEKAQTLFDKALVYEPKSAVFLTNRGIVDYRRNKFQEATAWFVRAIQADPNNARAWAWRGWILFENGQRKEAREMLQKTTALDPTSAVAFAFLGDACIQSHDNACAIAAYRKTVSLSPDTTLGQYNLVLLLVNSGDIKGAERETAEIERKAPGTEEALLARAYLAGANKDTAVMDEAIGKALALAPKNALVRVQAARTALLGGRYQEAIDHATAAIAIVPRGDAYRIMGLALGQMNRFKEAEIAFGGALIIDPDDDAAKRELELARQGKRPDSVSLQLEPHLPAASDCFTRGDCDFEKLMKLKYQPLQPQPSGIINPPWTEPEGYR